MGTYNDKDIVLLLGPYGVYMKYDDKNYRINQELPIPLSGLINIINKKL